MTPAKVAKYQFVDIAGEINGLFQCTGGMACKGNERQQGPIYQRKPGKKANLTCHGQMKQGNRRDQITHRYCLERIAIEFQSVYLVFDEALLGDHAENP